MLTKILLETAGVEVPNVSTGRTLLVTKDTLLSRLSSDLRQYRSVPSRRSQRGRSALRLLVFFEHL